MLVVGSVDRLEELLKKQQMAAKEVDGLLEGIEMYIKRTLYTDSKKKELEMAKEKIMQMVSHQDMIKVDWNYLDCTISVPKDRRKPREVPVSDCGSHL